eukprot:m.1054506 g.1054506  ORF g.1054506 m.1054506 type:complete len:294 (-) comp24189_c0_seq2:4153-5034(-)
MYKRYEPAVAFNHKTRSPPRRTNTMRNCHFSVLSAVLFASVQLTTSQDPTRCEKYDRNTGTGQCNGIEIDISSVICGDAFSKSCNATRVTSSGQTETFYFKGTPTGLPVGSSISTYCLSSDFPSAGGVAMAQLISSTGECYPAADIDRSVLFYSVSADNTIASVTLQFGTHTGGGGNMRSAFIQIKCTPGKRAPYTYTTSGDDNHQSIYEITVEADCTGGSGPQPGNELYRCWNNVCVESMSGSSRHECETVCQEPIPVTYVCKQGKCEVGAEGGTLAACEQLCRKDPDVGLE